MTEPRTPEPSDFNGKIIAEFRANADKVGLQVRHLLQHTGARSGTTRAPDGTCEQAGESFSVPRISRGTRKRRRRARFP